MKQLIFIVSLVFLCQSQLTAQVLDSLFAKRGFISTKIYRNGIKLSPSKIMSLYRDTWQPKVKYKWGHYMNPVGPVVAVGGIVLSVVALKGVDASAVIDGKVMDYKIRSLPKLLMGLGLFVGGVCIVESSNELVQHSADIYNARLKKQKKLSYVDKVKFGFTESANVGFVISLK